MPLRNPSTGEAVENKTVTTTAFYCHKTPVRNGWNHILLCRRLYQIYLVDMFAKIETERLVWFRAHQKTIRAKKHEHLRDAARGNVSPDQSGRSVILGSTFVGGPRYLSEKTQDAMCYVREYGKPDLFITFTCNHNWLEIKENLLPGQKSKNRPDIVARVFHLKLKKIDGHANTSRRGDFR